MYKILSFLITLGVLTGCAATGPGFDTTQYVKEISPRQVSADIETYQDARVMWGGIIISHVGFENGTQIEVLAYELGLRNAPVTTNTSSGRYLVWTEDYLEPLDYAAGRLVTTTGMVEQLSSSAVGDAEVYYPKIKAKKIHLWSSSNPNGPAVDFGFGIFISN